MGHCTGSSLEERAVHSTALHRALLCANEAEQSRRDQRRGRGRAMGLDAGDEVGRSVVRWQMSSSASAHGTPLRYVPLAPRGFSGLRRGFFGGIITGVTGLACHRPVSHKRLAQTMMMVWQLKDGFEKRWACRVAQALGAGATTITAYSGGPGLPERRGRRRAVAVHCTSPSQWERLRSSSLASTGLADARQERCGGSATQGARPGRRQSARRFCANLLPPSRPADAMTGPPSAAV